jgi:hypothetical protein
VNPSLGRNSSAMTSGAPQMPGSHPTLSRVVSGGGSAAPGLGCTPRSPVIPASATPPRNCRRLNRRACWLCISTSFLMLVVTTPKMPSSGRQYTRLPMMAHAAVRVCTGSGLVLPAVLTLDN